MLPPGMELTPHTYVVNDQRNCSVPISLITIIREVRIIICLNRIFFLNDIISGLRIDCRCGAQIGLDLTPIYPSGVIGKLCPFIGCPNAGYIELFSHLSAPDYIV
jgi:hypothetical protein